MKYTFMMIVILMMGTALIAQPPGGRPGGPPPQRGQGDGRGDGQGRPGPGGPQNDWIKLLDSNMDQLLQADEFQQAVDRTFAEIDRNGNGTIDEGELPAGPPPPPGGQGGRPGPGQGGIGGAPPQRMGPGGVAGRPGAPGDDDGRSKRLLPPFIFGERLTVGATKADFERIARGVFNDMDKNHDGVVDKSEGRPPRGDGGEPGRGGPPPGNVQFIAAELRFGDKLVKGQPFSAETVIEDTRRLFDGTTVTRQTKGAIYRDGAGRTRREQTLDMVGGVNIASGDNKPYKLIFINDFVAKAQYSLDLNNKVARRSELGNDRFPLSFNDGPQGDKRESLGTKTIDGISVEGTRISHEIPAGQLGNDKAIQVVTENWFSPELQVLVMSRHIDPIAGEHVFKLVNIKRTEPAADLFAVPTGFKVQNVGDGRGVKE